MKRIPKISAVLIMGSFFSAMACSHPAPVPVPVAKPQSSIPHEKISTANVYITPQFVTINQSKSVSYKIWVPPYASNAVLDGTFFVEPRPYATVNMVLVRESDYDEGEHPIKQSIIYQSREIAADKFHVSLAQGSYRLVFYNEASAGSTNSFFPSSTRTLYAQVRLSYDRPS